jgi:hypothetical protein
MSVRIMSLVFEYDMPNLRIDEDALIPDSTAKFVLLALADHASDDGEGAYPSVTRLCKKTSMSRGTVCNAIKALRHHGYILYEGESKLHTNNYTILTTVLVQPVELPKSTDRTLPSPTVELEPSLNRPLNHQEKNLKKERTSKKGDLLDGMLHFSKDKDKTDAIEKVLARLDKTFGLNLPRNPDWQSLAKFILEQTNPTLDQWITWYISDDFRMTSSIHITTDKIRMWWPKAHRVERPIQKPVEKEDEVYVTDLKERIEKLRKERENETNL